jgi:single-stranded-DNA-specific exonuclease
MEINCEKEFVSSLKYRWVYNEIESGLCFDHNLENIPCEISEALIKRGVLTEEDLTTYFDSPLNNLHNPFSLLDMDKAVERIYEAIKNDELICVYGDYDVDGVTSTSLLYLFLKEIGAKVTYYIPNRLDEGYGLNDEAIDDVISKKAKLVITVDCGITAVDEIEYATSMGIDVIITDHHQPSDKLPETATAIINPIRPGDTYPFKSLAGVGVAFKLVMALRYYLKHQGFFSKKLPNIKKYLDLVTLGTIADVVPLIGENRVFVKHGLQLLSERKVRIGINELMKFANLNHPQINTTHVGFMIAPRINAVGRMGCSDRGVRLLITEDVNEARRLAEEFNQENKYRQDIEKTILKESFEKIEKNKLHEKYKGIVLYSPDWHPGVIGIVASRVVEKYCRPTIVISYEGGVGKGSARSISAFHLYDGLKSISDLLIGFGGHKYAAGIKVDPDNLKLLQKSFHRIIDEQLEDSDFIPEIKIDAYLEANSITPELLEWLNRMRPFGAGNTEPVFCMKSVKKIDQFYFIGKDKAHLKGIVEKDGIRFDIIGYNMKVYKDYVSEAELFDILFVPEYNTWMGGKTIQLKLKDIRKSDLNG